MLKNLFGNTGLRVSQLTFGCGAVGGLMTSGSPKDQDRAVAWAIDNGINHFDTAPSYGNTASEKNLGRALGPDRDKIIISTKVAINPENFRDMSGTILNSLESSLKRLQQNHVDIFQLHNTIDYRSDKRLLTTEQILNDVLPAFEKLRDDGKIRFLGFTAKGKTESIHKLIDSGRFQSAQVFFNLLVPSAGEAIPSGYPAQDFCQLLSASKRQGMGSIGVRVLAGGALSGNKKRHPLSLKTVIPIGSSRSYSEDVQRALAFKPLIEEGYAKDLPELAIRYAISNSELPTVEIGIAKIEELKEAVKSTNNGPLSTEALSQIQKIQASFVSGINQTH